MPEITLSGRLPFDLEAQDLALSSAQNGIVTVTVPVAVSGSHQEAFQIRISLTPDQGDYLRRQLEPVVMTARRQGRYQKG